MTNESRPLFRPGAEVTGLAAAGVTGKRFLTATGRGLDGGIKVATATQGDKAFGVAAYDAGSGATVPVLRGGIVPVTAGGAISAGDQIEVGTDGKAVKLASGVAVGQAIETATSGADVFVALHL